MPYLNPASHDDRIDITINLATLSTGAQGFYPLLLGTNITLDGDRVRSYSTVSAAVTDFDAGFLDAWVLAAIREILGQPTRPDVVRVGRHDLAGGETIAQALDACQAVTTDFYLIMLESRTPADHVSLDGWIQAEETDGNTYLGLVQDDSADWLTAGVPAAYSTVEDSERLAVVYYGTDAAPRAEGWGGNRIGWDPDEVSVPWNAPVREVSYAFTATAITQAQKEFLRGNNANVLLPLGTKHPAYADPGLVLSSRPIDQIITADWFQVRLREALADLLGDLGAAGQKLGLNADGQNRIAGTFNAVALRGVTAGHFEAGQVLITPEAITTADRTAGRMRFTSGAQVVVGARAVEITVNVGTEAVL